MTPTEKLARTSLWAGRMEIAQITIQSVYAVVLLYIGHYEVAGWALLATVMLWQARRFRLQSLTNLDMVQKLSAAWQEYDKSLQVLNATIEKPESTEH